LFAVGLFWLFSLSLFEEQTPSILSFRFLALATFALVISPRLIGICITTAIHPPSHQQLQRQQQSIASPLHLVRQPTSTSPFFLSRAYYLSHLDQYYLIPSALFSSPSFFFSLSRHLAASPPSRHSCLFSPPTASRPFTSPGTSCQFHFWPGYPLASFAHPSPSNSL